MIGKLGMPELLVILGIALLIFGPSKLADLGKGLGEGLKGFKEGMKGIADPAPSAPVQQAAVNNAPQSASFAAGKANYRCPSCKNILTASAPNPTAAEDKGFCPECGSQFDKKSALV